MDVFCKIIEGEIPSYTVYEDDMVHVIMDVNPLSDGHCLVIPKEHYQDLYDIDDKVLTHIMLVGRKIALLLGDKLGCDGVTLEENNGCVQVVKHFHLHLIPSYHEKRVVQEDIETVFHKIVD